MIKTINLEKIKKLSVKNLVGLLNVSYNFFHSKTNLVIIFYEPGIPSTHFFKTLALVLIFLLTLLST